MDKGNSGRETYVSCQNLLRGAGYLSLFRFGASSLEEILFTNMDYSSLSANPLECLAVDAEFLHVLGRYCIDCRFSLWHLL